MSLFLKVMRVDAVDTDASEFALYADITSVRFVNHPEAGATAICLVRDGVKTATVPGFVEHEVKIEVPTVAYVMNENGKTVSTFRAPRPHA